MKTRYATLSSVCTIALLALIAVTSPASSQLVKIENAGEALVFHPVREAKGFSLTVNGPCNYEYMTRIDKGEIVFKLTDEAFDGAYTFSIDATPVIDREVMDVLRKARKTGDNGRVRELCRDGKLPTGPTSQSGGFTVIERQIVLDTTPESKRSKSDDGKRAATFSTEPRDVTVDELADDFRAASPETRLAWADTSSSTGRPEECVWARMRPAAGVAER